MNLIEHTSAINALGDNLKLIRAAMIDGWKMWEELDIKHRIALNSIARLIDQAQRRRDSFRRLLLLHHQ